MRYARTFLLLAAAALLFACNFPLFMPAVTPTTEPTATSTDTAIPQALPTFTAAPLPATATATVFATPTMPQVTPISANVNCRSGPDVAYDAVSVLISGTSTQVSGRNDDSSWWYVHDPSNPGAFCWISAGVVTFAGPQGGIPVVVGPAPIANQVTVDVALPSTITCGGPNPVTFSGTISTNGKADVKYQWEITGDKSNTTAPETLSFDEAGTKDVPDPGAYNVDCGNYKVTLHVIGPNNLSASKDFRVHAP
ncbi:MAG TPA: hypothetical protein VMJ64_12265 [Anaerolineales bacterium]|nr:hypothetical protein [Anaerolineales bacterium]